MHKPILFILLTAVFWSCISFAAPQPTKEVNGVWTHANPQQWGKSAVVEFKVTPAESMIVGFDMVQKSWILWFSVDRVIKPEYPIKALRFGYNGAHPDIDLDVTDVNFELAEMQVYFDISKTVSIVLENGKVIGPAYIHPGAAYAFENVAARLNTYKRAR